MLIVEQNTYWTGETWVTHALNAISRFQSKGHKRCGWSLTLLRKYSYCCRPYGSGQLQSHNEKEYHLYPFLNLNTWILGKLEKTQYKYQLY